MAFSDLIIKPVVVSIASDNTSFTVNDGTGTYDPLDPTLNPGGFGTGADITATRPSLDQVIRCFMYRFLPFSDISLIRLNVLQPALPATFANLSGAADRIIQVVELVFPNSFNWAELVDTYPDWDELIDIAYASGAVGQIGVWMNVDETNCVYDALRRFNNKFPNNCSIDEWLEKNAMFVGTAAQISVVGPMVPNQQTTEDLYADIQAGIDELVALCLDENCKCNN